MECLGVPGLSTANENGEIYLHCSQKCLQVYSSEAASLSVQVFQPMLAVGHIPLCVLGTSKVMKVVSCHFATVTLYLCVGKSSEATYAPLHVLVHIRTQHLQQFHEFDITHNLESIPKELSVCLTSEDSLASTHQLKMMDILKQVLLPALQQLGHSGLHSFLLNLKDT